MNPNRTYRFFASMICCLVFMQLSAQAPHFSQFTQMMRWYNPSFNGDFTGDLRASAHYRRQWTGPVQGFITQAVQAEYGMGNEEFTPNRLGLGLFVMNDKAGKAGFQILNIIGGAAYHLKSSDRDRLSFGLDVGYIHRNISYEGLAWDSQFNGYEYDPSLDDQELLYSQPIARGIDLAAGMHWRHTSRFNVMGVGYSFRHVGQDLSALQKGQDPLPLRQSVQFYTRQKDRRVNMQFDLLFSKQKRAMELVLGTRGEYRFGDDSRYTDVNKSSAVYAGVYYRVGDAFTPVLGFEWERTFSIHLSYDFPLSQVRKVVGFAGGGPEISLVYTGAFGARRKVSGA